MSKMDLDNFGAIIDQFLEQNEIHMMLTMPEGTLDVQVQDNVGLGCVVQFYILLDSVKSICGTLRSDLGIDGTSPEWAKTVDVMLGMIRAEMLDADEKGGDGDGKK